MSVLGDELPIYRQRYQALQQYHDSHEALLKDLFVYCQRLESAFHSETTGLQRALADAQLDLDDARNSRRNLQQKVQNCESEIQQLTKDNENFKNRHPYVAVLIDGDGLLFQDSYINDGIEGGKRAAQALRAAVASQCGDLASKVEIVVKVCANLSGLATAMRYAGSISNEIVFKQFSLGFTQSKASFDFIDVGHGKERADSKIREDARWHLNNPNCKLVMLGISHDSGYAPFLDELRSDRDTLSRLRILEGSPTVRELVATNIEILNLNGAVFRSDKLTDRTMSSNGASSSPPASTVNGAGPAPSVTQGLTVLNISEHDGTKGTNAANGTKDKDRPALKASPAASYASATTTGASPPPSLTFPAATTKNLQVKAAAAAAAALMKKQAAWSPGPRGLDPPATYNPTVIDSIKKRQRSDKFCNSYILNNYCTNDYCEYNHNLKATADEKRAIAYMMRQFACSTGQDCTVDDCIYGHNCPSVRDGVCLQPYCRFSTDLHPPKTKFKQPHAKD